MTWVLVLHDPNPRVPLGPAVLWVHMAPLPRPLTVLSSLGSSDTPVSPISTVSPRVLMCPDPAVCLQVEQELLSPGGPGTREGPAVLLVTGRLALAQRAPRVALLEGGRLRELGNPGELRTLPWGTAGDTGDGEGDD